MSSTTIRRTNPTGYASLTTDCSEWGPARHDPERTHDDDRWSGTDLRDGDDALPDDN